MFNIKTSIIVLKELYVKNIMNFYFTSSRKSIT